MIPSLITKATRVLHRDDGSEVRIIATTFFGAGLHPSVGLDVLHREKDMQHWDLCYSGPYPPEPNIPEEESARHEQSEVLSSLSIGQVLSVVGTLSFY